MGVEWAKRFPAQFDKIVFMPNPDLSAATRGLGEPARAWLTMDVAILIARLAHLADARRLRVSFGAVRTDQCRKFHVDYVRRQLEPAGEQRIEAHRPVHAAPAVRVPVAVAPRGHGGPAGS